MKCSVCDTNLSDYEQTIRHADTKQFLDTCTKCISDIGNIPVLVRPDLITEMDLDAVDSLLDGDDDEFYREEDIEDDVYKDLWDER